MVSAQGYRITGVPWQRVTAGIETGDAASKFATTIQELVKEKSPRSFRGKLPHGRSLVRSLEVMNVIAAAIPVCLLGKIDITLSQMLPLGA